MSALQPQTFCCAQGKSFFDRLRRQEIVNPIANIVEADQRHFSVEAQMNAPHSEFASDKSIPDSALETETASAAKQAHGERSTRIGGESERIISSVSLFTSKSIKELEALTFELQGLQEFLKSETERVQSDIDNALAGLKIIIDTISPWRSARPDPSVQDRSTRPEPRLQRSNLAGSQK